MNVHNNLILVKGIDKTQEIESCKYDINQHKYFIKFNTSPQEYPYGSSNVTWLKNPKIIKPDSVKISHNGTVFFDMQDIFDFDEYYRIIFGNGKTGLYMKSNIKIEKNSLHNDVIRSSFEYFKELADKISIKTDEGKNLLLDQYEKIDFISSDSALSIFLQPDINMPKICSSPSLYFPFGCNLSQMQAVQKAFSNKISVIEGPPGTGKTR